MIKYYCKTCKLETDTSECPICGERTQMKSKIYWCNKCNIPIYEEKCTVCGIKGKYIGTDIRPVFPEERLLLEILIDEPFKFIECSVWNTAGNHYIVNGKKLTYAQKDLMKQNPQEVINKLQRLETTNNYNQFDKYLFLTVLHLPL